MDSERNITREAWVRAVAAKAPLYPTHVRLRRRISYKLHDARTWLALRIAPWLY